MFHDYHGGVKETEKLLEGTAFFIWVDAQLSRIKAMKSIDLIPFSQFFLETDDQEIKIEDRYVSASQRLKVDTGSLEKQLEENFENLKRHLSE